MPLLSLIVAIPFLVALIAGSQRDRDLARRLAAGATLAQLALSLGAIARHWRPSAGYFLEESWPMPWSDRGAHWHLGLDGLSALFLPLVPLIASGVIIGGPRRRLDPSYLAAALITAATSAALVLAADLGVLAAMWFASLIPNFNLLRRHAHPVLRDELRRSYALYLFAGSLPLLLAVVRIAIYGMHKHRTEPFDLTMLTDAPLPHAAQEVVFFLLLGSILVRMGVFPLHSWMPLHVEHGPLGIGVMTLGTHLGVYTLARLLPIVPEAAREWMPELSWVALGSAVFGSALGLVQTNLRRAVGFLVVSQSSLMLLGLASLTGPGVHGALLQALASGGAVGGLLLVVWALEARTGTADFRRFGGFSRTMPRMATAFFLFAAAAVGFPGTLMFISEDLIIHGIVDRRPAVTAAVLFAMATNAFTLFRGFTRTFLGEDAEREEVLDPDFVPDDAGRDLLVRERWVVIALAGLVVGGGLYPQVILDLTAESVEPLALADAGPGPQHARAGH